MKTLKILVAAGLTLASVSSIAGVNPGTGIQATKHDWSASARSFLLWCPATGCTGAIDAVTGVASDATTYQATGYIKALKADGTQGKAAGVSIGMCTTCHTPHQARSTTLLWNHTLLNTEYSWDAPATTAGTLYPTFKGDTYRGASTKCLSCHDGLMSSTDGMWFNRKRVTTSAYVATGRSAAEDSGHHVAHHDDMSASHPVAFPYPYGKAPNAYNGTTTSDLLEVSEFVSDPTTAGIRLFNDDGSGNIIAGPAAGMTGMECTSCHDVHNGKNTKDVMLLRGKLAGSDQASGYICTQCHTK
jgi:hypothetical protein